MPIIKSISERNAGVGKLVNPLDLKNLSALLETVRVERVKFGEGLTANTEPSLERGRCRD